MRIKGLKKPISKHESFTMVNSKVQKVDKCERIVKIFLTRTLDGEEFAISENQFMKFFIKKDESIDLTIVGAALESEVISKAKNIFDASELLIKNNYPSEFNYEIKKHKEAISLKNIK